MQTKGVRAVVKIETAEGAWISAVAAVGAAIVGTAIMWPVMKRYLRKYDESQITLPTGSKDSEGNTIVVEAGAQKYKDVEEDK